MTQLQQPPPRPPVHRIDFEESQSETANRNSNGMPPAAAHEMPPNFRFTMAQAFMGRLAGDMCGALICALCILGDRLGLFRELSILGSATIDEFSDRVSINRRYAKEWLSALTASGYLEYDAINQRFSLPAEHAGALVAEGGPMFMGGAFQQTLGMYKMLEHIENDLRQGIGIPQSEYDANLMVGMERLSASWYQNQLASQWVVTVPNLAKTLAAGARVADIGCGGGRAVIALAKAFPATRLFGFDAFPLAIARANTNAQAAGVTDQVSFEVRDILCGLPDRYDLITVFNAAHDFDSPTAAFSVIRQSLKPGGCCLILEPNCSDQIEQNLGEPGAILFSTSMLYSVPISLANGGDSPGAMGLPESKLVAICTDAGFSACRKVASDQFNALYVTEP